MNSPVFHFDIVQGTQEWYDIRSGKITASTAKTFLVNGKQEGGFGVGAITEMYKIAEERLTGIPRESFATKATNWGHEYEAEAVEAYELKHFIKTLEIGFVSRDEWTGASPDRIVSVEKKKGLEAKCLPKEHLEIFDTGVHDKDHYTQCQFNLWVTKYESWDLVYYHPRLPETCNMIEFTFLPDLQLFERFDERVEDFKKMVEIRLNKYTKRA